MIKGNQVKTKVNINEISSDMLKKYLKDKKIKMEDIKNESVEMTESELIKYGVYEECNEVKGK